MGTRRPTGGSGPTRPSLLLAPLVLTLGVVTSPPVDDGAAADAPASAQSATTTWGIQPASRGDVGTRPAFAYDLAPGTGIDDAVRITNYSEVPLTLALYAADAFNNDQGGYDVSAAAAGSDDVGTWVALPESEITVPARARVDVPFTIDVPDDAEPGDHAGGIVTSLTTEVEDEDGNRVRVDHRVGTRIYVRVDGPLRPALTIQDIQLRYSGRVNPVGRGPVSLSYTVHNAGNVRLAAHQTVKLEGPAGIDRQEIELDDLPELLPGSSVRFTVPIDDPSADDTTGLDSWPMVRVRAVVTLDPIGDVPADRVAASAVAWAIPWSLLVLLAACAGVVVARRRRRAAAAAIGSGDTATTGGAALDAATGAG